ncbi:MAG TPA: hypothetical protein VN679_03805 [Candidatus Acidoferrales bacterium]|nr:hypothetical protein [Candidatus Acidoferrales bacterium]
MSTPSMSPQMPGGMPPAPPKSSGAKVILWIVGVFAALVIFVIVALAGLGFFFMHKAKQAGLDPELIRKNPGLAAAKMVVMNNPQLQVVSSNDNTGTMVVREKKSGKTTTLKFDAAKKTMVVIDDQGKQASITADTDSGTLVMKGDDGTVKIGANANSAPGWVPVYPGVSPQNTMSVEEKGKQSGTYVFASKDSPDKIMSYYSEQLTSAGMKLTTTTAGSDGGVISANQDGDARTVLVTVSSDTEGTHVSVTYGQKKDGKGEL